MSSAKRERNRHVCWCVAFLNKDNWECGNYEYFGSQILAELRADKVGKNGRKCLVFRMVEAEL